MIKGQDIVLLVKLITNKEARKWGQVKLSQHLCVSSSTVNASLQKLRKSKLIVDSWGTIRNHTPVKANCKEFIPCIRYVWPANKAGMTVGMFTGSWLTSSNGLMIPGGSDVWPDAEGKDRGFELTPLYPSVPRSLRLYPDQPFYKMLCLIDRLRDHKSTGIEDVREQLTKRIEECL